MHETICKRSCARYVDELQCATARVVHAGWERAKSHNNNAEGLFDAFHVRRGDFQYRETRVEASELYDMAKDQIPEGCDRVLYMATDERNKHFSRH